MHTTPGKAFEEEAGFTLIELLTVMLILAILAAVALPAFIGQKEKATDTRAKATAHTATIAINACGLESSNGFEACDVEALRAIEPTLPPPPTLEVSGLGRSEYTIVVHTIPVGRTYTVEQSGKGNVEFTCVEKGDGGCPTSGRWG